MPHDSDLREVLFPPKDEPLRQDVRLLGDLVGAVIREQGQAHVHAVAVELVVQVGVPGVVLRSGPRSSARSPPTSRW